MLGLTRYQYLVLFAAWLGWGFDIFDGLLFNFVAPICVPNLLGLSPSDPHTKVAIFPWTAGLTSLLLVGWALGGILFGKITDRLGRTRTLLLTMLTYALATAACAFAPNIYVLAVFRFIASLGIGGEWAAGATLVAESLPREKRVAGGVVLYTSASFGLALATWVNDLFTRTVKSIALDPGLSWRVVFLTGLVPAAVAIVIRLKVKEPETWKPAQEPRVAELFVPPLRRRTLGGFAMALVALITWWSCGAFIPVVAAQLAQELKPLPPPLELAVIKTQFITRGSNAFNLGGLIGTLLCIPAASLGRKNLFRVYFTASVAALLLTFIPSWPATTRLNLLFTLGLSVFGVFGAFPFYLPELFPMRLRGTGGGFTYNFGRIITAPFPWAVGFLVKGGADPLRVMSFIAIVPALGAILAFFGAPIETRDEVAEHT
ncbi:MAG TPA: MFS transporter [Polyangiaceae bacterium]|nr:MFS transporter [Polyangiaceae bacterium]